MSNAEDRLYSAEDIEAHNYIRQNRIYIDWQAIRDGGSKHKAAVCLKGLWEQHPAIPLAMAKKIINSATSTWTTWNGVHWGGAMFAQEVSYLRSL